MATETVPLLTTAVGLVTNTGGTIPRAQVKKAADVYEDYHSTDDGSSRELNYTDMVNKYYDLSTSFFEYGWGQSFHFAHRWKGESHRESLLRYEHFLGLRLGLKPGMKVLDIGCGIGGPLRELVSFSGASITGLNNNAYQIQRAKVLSEGRRCLEGKVDFVTADFMNIPFPDNTFDAAYQIEATCHAPNVVACYKEINRIIKPGGHFAGYEWCITDAFNPNDPSHVKIKRDIEVGNGLSDIRSTSQVVEALQAAGFEVVEAVDLATTAEVSWDRPLAPEYFPPDMGGLVTPIGRFLTGIMVAVLEFFRLAPKGSLKVNNFLVKGAYALCAGARKEIFTPIFFFLARKK